MADTELKLIISADNAQAVSKIKEFANSVEGVTSKIEKGKQGQDKLSESIFKGVASWDLLKKGVHEATDFIKDSIQAFTESESKMSLVRETVTSMGQDYEKVRPQIEEFSGSMARLGRDDEDVALATARLAKLVGGDLKKGMELAKLASDLTSSGFNDFESNVDNLSSVLVGKGQRALTNYKLNLDENATTSEQLNAITQKVTRTTEEWSETVEGRVAIAKTAFENLKEEIGRGVVDAFQNLFNKSGDLTGSLQNLSGSAKEVRAVTYSLASFAIGAAQAFNTMAKGVAFAGLSVANLLKPKDEIKEMGKALADDIVNSWEKIKQTFTNAVNPINAITRAEAQQAAQTKTLTQEYKNLGEGIKNANAGATQSAGQHQTAVKKLKDTYENLKERSADTLADMEQNHKEKLASIQKEIGRTQESLKELAKEFAKEKQSDTQKVAEEIVATEKRIADIQKELQGDVSDERRVELQQELSDKQKALQDSADFQKGIEQELTEARRRTSLTDLGRAIEDYKNKRLLAEQEYVEKIQRLQNELTELDKKQKAELELYAAKETKIKEIMERGRKEYEEVVAKKFKFAKEKIEEEIALYNRLADTIARVKSDSAGARTSGIAVPHLASGGVVTSPTLAVVGEAGPEAIVPLKSAGGSISTGGNIIINLRGDFYTDRDVAMRWAGEIAKEIKRHIKI